MRVCRTLRGFRPARGGTLCVLLMARHTERIDLRVPRGDKEAWQIEAKRRGLDLSEVVRRAVPDFFASHPPKRGRTRASAGA